jgi:hypothetical protein
MGNLAHSSTNDNRYDDLVKEVKELGRDAAAGKDSLPKLAHRIVRAAADGIIGTDKDKDGRDEAAKQYEFYVQAESKKAIHEHSNGGVKANVSKLRKLIEFGVMPIIDPVAVMDRAYQLRKELLDTSEKLLPAYAAYVDIAREQLAQPGTELNDEQIKGCLRREPAKEKQLKDVLEKIHKDLEQLISGERKDGIKDQSDEVVAAEEILRSRIAALLKKEEDEALNLALAKRGMVAVHAIEDQSAAA